MSMTCYIISFTTSFHIISSFPSTSSVYCSYYFNSVPFTSASLSILTFEQVSPLFRFGFTLSNCILCLYESILIVMPAMLGIWDFFTVLLFPSPKEWPVYSWIYGSEKSIARYRESPVGIFNFLSILWRLNPSKQRAMRSTKKF